jgi:hypothetical protein
MARHTMSPSFCLNILVHRPDYRHNCDNGRWTSYHSCTMTMPSSPDGRNMLGKMRRKRTIQSIRRASFQKTSRRINIWEKSTCQPSSRKKSNQIQKKKPDSSVSKRNPTSQNASTSWTSRSPAPLPSSHLLTNGMADVRRLLHAE